MIKTTPLKQISETEKVAECPFCIGRKVSDVLTLNTLPNGDEFFTGKCMHFYGTRGIDVVWSDRK